MLGDEVGAIFADLHRDTASTCGSNSGVTRVRRRRGVTGVPDRREHRCRPTLVVVGVGIRPDTGLAAEAGLAVDNGVLVDASLRTSDPDIYAAGDVANWRTRSSARRPGRALGQRANGGPAAARAMLGQDVDLRPAALLLLRPVRPGPGVLRVGPAGLVRPGGDPRRPWPAGSSSRSGCRGGRVLAGMNVNVWDVTDPIQDLVTRKSPVDTTRLADPAVPLGEL